MYNGEISRQILKVVFLEMCILFTDTSVYDVTYDIFSVITMKSRL